MKVLMVLGSGIPIPPPAWGGAENILYQQAVYLRNAGHTVDILNAARKKTIAGILQRPWRYDVVHVHQDGLSNTWLKLARWFGFKLAVTSHYGYAAFPEKWGPHGVRFERTLESLIKVPYLIHLSGEIEKVMLDAGYKGKSFVLPNGIHTADFAFNPAPAAEKAILLGKIEPRKKQLWLADTLRGKNVHVDLVGPAPENPDFTGNGANVPFLGPWNRDIVKQKLTEYAAMLLISDGEAHAGVLLEALAAGCSLVVTPESAHNFDLSLPFVYTLDRDKDDVAAVIYRAITENAAQRTTIHRYCEDTFDWKVIGPLYEKILQEIVHDRR